MKRLQITTLVIGIAVAIVVGALHASKAMAGVETAAAQLFADYVGATRIVGEKWQYGFVLLIALGVAWLSLSMVPRWRSRLLIGLLLVELLGLSWVCSLYRTFFQPIPSVAALVFAFAIAEGWSAFLRRDRSHLLRTLFADRVSNKEFRRLRDGTTPFDAQPKAYDVTAVVCDIGNKLAFTQDPEPAAFAEATAKFIRETAAHLVNEGAYLQAADGEGVVAIFGFPGANPEHVQKAVCVVVDMIKNFRKRQQEHAEAPAGWDIHAGISSGVIIAGALKDSERPQLLARGKPIELARRFCALNHFYGSAALMDTPTFDRVSDTVVARPIDFVSGLDSHDRLEIYEPLWLAAEASPEHIARRDSFWSGVVLYREKRWAEAYNEFQKARDSEAEDDPPLQFYLRRLEPLVLQLTEPPLE
jgi:class 3 adenylate cyclase